MEKTKEKPIIKKWQLIFFGVVILSALFLKIWQYRLPTAQISLGGNELKVMVANNVVNQQRGLGGRDNLGDYDGMLFTFNNYSRLEFVMRDMRFPIDIIWLSHNQVIDIAQNVQLEPGVKDNDLTRYYPRVEANMVLEVPAGWSQAHNLKLGDILVALDK